MCDGIFNGQLAKEITELGMSLGNTVKLFIYQAKLLLGECFFFWRGGGGGCGGGDFHGSCLFLLFNRCLHCSSFFLLFSYKDLRKAASVGMLMGHVHGK